MRKYRTAIIMFLVFEVIAVWLWLSTGNLFFLLNFSYLGISIGGGAALLAAGWKYGRELTQFLVGSYMLVFLGLICRENMQIEGFWFYIASAFHHVYAFCGWQRVLLCGRHHVGLTV